MKKRYQVFVSSTYLDLKEERQAVFGALLRLDYIPAGMEFFPASDSDPLSFIKQVIDECDYYIVIVAGKYGTVFKEDGISYTEREYKYARQKGIPVLAFLHESPESIEDDKRERGADKQTKLEAFRESLRSSQCGYWKTAVKLKEEVLVGVPRLIEQYPRPGLVRADSDFEKDQVALAVLRKQNELLEIETANLKSRFGASLAGGETPVSVKVKYSVGTNGHAMREQMDGSYLTTWNDLFSLLSPSMQTWVSQHGFSKAANGLIGERLQPSLLLGHGSRSRVDNIYITSEHFDTIVVHFKALGLIDVSERDGNRFFRLTETGEAKMFALRTVKKE